MNISKKLSIFLAALIAGPATLLGNTFVLQNSPTYSGCIDTYASVSWSADDLTKKEYISLAN